MPEETKKDEILEAIAEFSNHTEERFDRIESRLDKVDNRLGNVENKLDKVEGKVGRVEAVMVTKDYLDDKLADLQGDLILIIRKEDTKLAALVEILKERKVIDDGDIRRILSLEPFPKTL